MSVTGSLRCTIRLRPRIIKIIEQEKTPAFWEEKAGVTVLSNNKGGVMLVVRYNAATQQCKCGNVFFALNLA